MGLDINAVQFLLAARKSGAQFGQVLMLGRQSLNVFPAKMAEVLARHGLAHDAFQQGGAACAFAEPLFHALGAKEVSALDASDFEGATVVQDLNLPVRADLKARFDVVYDGGTLEHVFNFPTALQTCMEMVRVGGHLFIHTIINNCCGHGFYQFSPELFHRAFSAENGYEVQRMLAHVIGPYGRWYEITDPNNIGERVELITFAPMQMLVQARRTKAVPVFAQAPQQSDYSVMWQKQAAGQTVPAVAAAAAAAAKPGVLKGTFPGLARLVHVGKMGVEFYRRQSLRNRKFFRPVKRE